MWLSDFKVLAVAALNGNRSGGKVVNLEMNSIKLIALQGRLVAALLSTRRLTHNGFGRIVVVN
jgi:hypothetical protein